MAEYVKLENIKKQKIEDQQKGLVIRGQCQSFSGSSTDDLQQWMADNHYPLKRVEIFDDNIVHFTFLRTIEADNFQSLPYVKYKVWKCVLVI